MKKRLYFVFVFVLLLGQMLSIVSFASGAAGGYNITLIVEKNDDVNYSGSAAYSVSFAAQSDSLKLKGPQALCFAVDLTEFDLLDRTGNKLSVELSTEYYTSVGNRTVYADGEDESEWSTMAFYALSEDGKTAFVSLQPYNMRSQSLKEETILETVLIGIKPGKIEADITKDSVRLMTSAEAARLGQDVIMLGTGSDIYIFGSITGKADSELISCGVKTDFPSVSDENEQKEPAPSTDPVIDDKNNNDGSDLEYVSPFAGDEAGTEWQNPFSDVSESDKYYKAVRFVYERNLFNGVSKTRFAPHSTMTRAMFVTVLGRLAGVDQSRYTGTSFNDADVGLWYSAYVEWAAENDIVNGYGNGKFGVNDEVTIEQAAAIIARYARFVGIDTSSAKLEDYIDKADVSDWAKADMAWITSEGVYVAENGKLLPKDKAERSLVATMMYGFVNRFTAWTPAP